MWCMCGGCQDCNPIDEDAVLDQIAEEVEDACNAAMDQWLDFDSLCRSLGDRAPGSIDKAHADAERYVYAQYGVFLGE